MDNRSWPNLRSFFFPSNCYIVAEKRFFFLWLDIRIKEEPDSEEWSLAGDSTLNTNDLSHLRVRLVEDEMEGLGQEGKRLRRVACTCPNCKEGGGR